MTVTIKLDAALEQQLRQRAASTGRSTSDVVRAALQQYLAQADPAPPRSAFALGEDLFGRHVGSADLAQRRRAERDAVWADRHQRRSA
jgi:plasmid stability protein